MAKSDFGNKQELQEYLAGLKQVDAQYKILNAEAKKLRDIPGDANNQVKQQLRDLRSQYDTHKEIGISIKRAQKELDGFKDAQQKISKEARKTADVFGELEGLQASITNEYGRQSVQAKSLEAIVDKTKAQYNGITSILNNNTEIQGHQKDVINQALDIYKNFPVVLNGLEKQLKRNEITAEGFQDSIIKTEQGFRDLINQMDEMIPGVKEIKDLLDSLPEGMKKNAAAAAAMKKQFAGIDAAQAVGGFALGGVAGGSGIVSHTADIGKNLISGTDLKTIGFVGLGLAIIEFTAQLKGTQLAAAKAANAIEKATLENKLLQREIAIDLANGLPGEEAMIKFKYQLQEFSAEFSKSSQTALFGGVLDDMPYATDQLQLAGIGAETVVSAMHDLSKTANMGIFPQLAANAAVFAKKMGISTSELGTQIGLFRQLNKVGGEQAYGGVTTTLSSTEGINPVDVSMEMAGASKMAMTYNIKSYEALAKQVMAAKQLGVSWSQIAEDGRNMVLNYKDTIKGEMELSAMLGERVDLSEVMALINAGQVDAAQKAFNATGLAERAREHGLFTQQKLQSIVGESINAGGLAAKYETGKNANVPTNDAFLQSLTNATAALNSLTAVIQLQQTGELSTFGVKKTTLERGDAVAMGIAGELISFDATAFFREQLAKGAEMTNLLGGQNGISIPGVNPFGTGTDNVKNGKVVNTPSTGKSTIVTPIVTPTPSTGRGIDYSIERPNFVEKDAISKQIAIQQIQQQQLANLNSHTETSVELLKSLRDLTAIMLDPDRKKDFNVQLNMDGKQIKNVLIRNNQRDLGTTRDGLTFSTQGAKS
jgi:hypothetical protein